MTSMARSTTTTTMKAQRASPFLSSGGRAARRPPAASTARAMGQRLSPVPVGTWTSRAVGSWLVMCQLTSR